MNKSKRSILNAISAAILNFGNGLLSFVVTYLVINKFGSDFNGINSAANQIVSVLLIIEGGFTIATNVALFKPFAENDIKTFNSIVSATKIQFKKIGLLFLGLGIVVAFIYSILVQSIMDRSLIFTIVMMAIFPSAINLYFATKYRILIQAEQKEYIISLVSIMTVFSGHLINITLLQFFNINMINIRFVTMIFSLLQSLLLMLYCKRTFLNVNFDEKPNFSLIKGTKDVVFLKITSAVYSTLPVLGISVISENGAMLVSVYSIYNNVLLLIKSMLQAVMDGPRLSLGQVIAEVNEENTIKQFTLYEFITVVILVIFLSTVSAMIFPFVKWYSKDFSDINYINYYIAIILILTTFFEVIHIPSGNYINMSGDFKKAKVIQLMATIILVLGSVCLSFFMGIYGILSSVLLTAIYLCIREVFYIHYHVLKNMRIFLHISITNFIIFILTSLLWVNVLIAKDFMFIELFIYAVIVFLSNIFVILVWNYFFNKNYLMQSVLKICNFLK